MAKILIVEDNEGIREVLTVFLTKQNHAISTAENGREAVEIITQLSQDLVITDTEMPEMNGVELAQWLKENYSEIPVILTSGKLESENHLADDFVRKPFNLAELKATIEMILLNKATQKVR